MQDRYVGDIGDFVKLAILRALSPGRRLGVGWWLHPNSGRLGDGPHIGYLDQREAWRHLDPELFDALDLVVRSGRRQVAALEEAALVPDATYFREAVPIAGPPSARLAHRHAWFGRLKRSLEDCDLVFLDPDNGLEPTGFSPRTAKAGKCVSLAELRELRKPGRALVVYHHQTRRRGGHHEEIGFWSDRFRNLGFSPVDALRSKPFSARAFFILGADEVMRRRAASLCQRWGGPISWHPGAAGGEEDQAA